jgi:hypothetical protein
VLLTVTSGDEPSVITADGWSMTVDRLFIGLGNAGFEPRTDCETYSDSSYDRLLDATLSKEQKLSIIYALGNCPFHLNLWSPSPEAVLGEGVTEADREAMGGLGATTPNRPPVGIAVDFAATALRGAETKRMHWRFRQFTSYGPCSPRAEDRTPLPLVLHSDENLTVRTAVRGTVLFADDAAATASLRFDPMAEADTTPGGGDGEVTLQELGMVRIEDARRFGPYGCNGGLCSPRTLEDYLYQVLFQQIVQFSAPFGCDSNPGTGPQ